MNDFALEILGYVASALIVLSLAMTSVVRLRIVSLIGSATFTVYGVLIDALPVALTNGVIVVINIVYLYRLFTKDQAFDVVELEPESEFITRYIDHHRPDIDEVWPRFHYQPKEDQIRLMVLRDMVPAGLFIARMEGDTAIVEIDYAGKDFRDLKNARFLFGPRKGLLLERGIERVVTRADSEVHRKFLERFGFEHRGGHYEFDLTRSSVSS